MDRDVIIPEFKVYEMGLDPLELDDIRGKIAQSAHTEKDRFRRFTDILIECVGSGEWMNRSDAFLSMIAKACFMRGMYGYNQLLSKGNKNAVCRAYAALAYCRQNLDPRWLSNLRNYVNQMWQAQNYVGFAELSGQLASVLIDLGYHDHAHDVATDSIEKVTEATRKDTNIRASVQAALLDARLMLAHLAELAKSREEALMRLNSADETARILDHELALTDISYYRALTYVDSHEYEKSLSLVENALRKYDRMGYLQGLANARNLRGIIFLNMGQAQDARDQFEDLLIVQQQLNNQIGLARTLINVGEIDRALGQIDQMETYNRKALEISQEAEFMKGIASATLNLGDVAVLKGKLDQALQLYRDALEVAERSGMKDVHLSILFQVSDTYFLKGDFEAAIEAARKAKDMSVGVNYPLYSMQADASEIMAMWEAGSTPPKQLLDSMRSLVGPLDDWLRSPDASPMTEVRKNVFDDPTIDSDLCVFHDVERNFVCGVERKTLSKECVGNLFWMGSLCPFFKDFLSRLDKSA